MAKDLINMVAESHANMVVGNQDGEHPKPPSDVAFSAVMNSTSLSHHDLASLRHDQVTSTNHVMQNAVANATRAEQVNHVLQDPRPRRRRRRRTGAAPKYRKHCSKSQMDAKLKKLKDEIKELKRLSAHLEKEQARLRLHEATLLMAAIDTHTTPTALQQQQQQPFFQQEQQQQQQRALELALRLPQSNMRELGVARQHQPHHHHHRPYPFSRLELLLMSRPLMHPLADQVVQRYLSLQHLMASSSSLLEHHHHHQQK
jgi:hypothetical protein